MGHFSSFSNIIAIVSRALVIMALGTTLTATLLRAQHPFRRTAPACDSAFFCPEEELEYEVSYLNMKLGRVRVKMLSSDTASGGVNYRAASIVDSYNGIPFVDIHVIDSTIMDAKYFSRGFHSFEKHDSRWLEEFSRYDLDNHRIIVTKTYHDNPDSPPATDPKYDTVKILDKNIEDGLSLFFYARARVRKPDTATAPTVVYGKRGLTKFRFATERSTEEIDALKDKKIRVVRLEGNAEFKGLYGMTGEFNGWFSDDIAAVPIKAQLGVFIGNVNIELVKWNRPGWQPPTEP